MSRGKRENFPNQSTEGELMEKQLDEALQVLGIPADSDRQTVTGAYRRLARATHPDVSPNPDAAERFATVAAAYRLVTGVPDPRHHVRQRSEDLSASECSFLRRPASLTSLLEPADLTDHWSTPAQGGVRFLLGAWPVGPAGEWHRPPIVAGPVVVRRVQPDGGSRDG
jgi:hypothetical protein